jgi:hypothetical protein
MQNETPKEYHKQEGTISKVETNQKNGPKGWFYMTENGKDIRYTCWSATILNNFKAEDEVIITYLNQDNEYNGKTYHNRVIDRIEFKDKGQNELTDKNYELLEQIGYRGKTPKARQIIKSENSVIKMGGLNYRIKDFEVELLAEDEN